MSVESKFNERYSLYELTHGPTYLVFKHQPSPKKTSLEAKLLIIQNQDSLSIALAIFFHFGEISSRRTAGANMYSLHRPLCCQAARANILQRSKLSASGLRIRPSLCSVYLRDSNLCRRILAPSSKCPKKPFPFQENTHHVRAGVRRHKSGAGCPLSSGAGDGDRTRNFQLGKLTLYH